MLEIWDQIDGSTLWGYLEPAAVLFYTDDDAVVVDATKKDSKIALRIQRIGGEQFERKVQATEPLYVQARKLLPHGNVRAVLLPAVMWGEDALWSPRNIAGLATASAVCGAGSFFIAATDLVGFAYFVMAGALGAGAGVRRLWKTKKLAFAAPERLGLSLETVLPFALAREQGRLWVAPSWGADRRELACSRVEAIRGEYGRLRGDIAYRIECSALFDPAVESTAVFEAALVAFDEARDVVGDDEVDRLASEVEVSFNVAREYAQRVGFLHLPEGARADGRRAGKAARLAAGAGSSGERVAALEQVKKILDSLALYYLPRLDEQLAIEAPLQPTEQADQG